MLHPSFWRVSAPALALAFLIPVACSSSSDANPGGTNPDGGLGDGAANGDASADGGVTFPPPPHGFALVKDINTRSGASFPGSFAFGDALYFAADDGVHGSEIWKSDLTGAGTKLFIDTIPGSGSGFPNPLAAVGNRVVFTRLDPVPGFWSSDGTDAGTVKLADVDPCTSTGVVIGSTYYFCGEVGRGTPQSELTLWSTDGTPGGTKSLGAPAQATPVVTMGGNVFFIGSTNDGNAIFRFAPESGVTTALTAAIGVDDLVASSTKLFFYGNAEGFGLEPWVSDGTPGNTQPTADVRVGPETSITPSPSTAFYDGAFYFVADDGVHGVEVWKTDGTGPNTVLVADIRPGNVGSSPSALTAGPNGVYFAADDGVHGLEPWITNGTPEGTHLLKDVMPGNPATTSSGVLGFSAVNGAILFVADDGVHGTELWKSDGSEAGTAMVVDLLTGRGGSTALDDDFLVAGGKLVYSCASDATENELCASDGTAAGTQVVADIHPGTAIGVFDVFPTGPGRLAILAIDDATEVIHFWTSDETAAGTTRASATLNALSGGLGFRPATIGTTTLLWGRDADHGDELWKTDETEAGTILVKDIQPGPASGLGTGSMFAVGSVAFFAADDGTNGLELWKTDGTSDGTARVTDLGPAGIGLPSPIIVGAATADAFFFGGTDASGSGVFRADGTGVTKISGGAVPVALTTTGTKVIWLTNLGEGTGGACVVWSSDGTQATSGNVSTIQGNCGQVVAAAPGTVAISLHATTGSQLWTSDGTGEGTKQLGAFDSLSPLASASVWMNGALYFGASTADKPTGVELWRSDMTPAGTALFKEIQAGTAGSFPRAFVLFGGVAYFDADDGVNGGELWSTDGTAAGTLLRGDLRPGLGGSNPIPIVGVGTKLYFRAGEGAYGTELWSFDPTP